MTDMLNVTVYDGKYTVIQDDKGRTRALRYGEEWRDCVGDGLILALAQEVEALRTTDKDPGVERVRVFHEAFGAHVAPEPWMPELSEGDRAAVRYHSMILGNMAVRLKSEAAAANDLGRAALGLLLIRLQLLVEETGELAEAWAEGDMVKVLDALTDISYVADGTYLTHGLGAVKVAADEEVHASNMTKLGEDGRPIIHVSGRVVKGPNYRPPDLAAVLRGREGEA